LSTQALQQILPQRIAGLKQSSEIVSEFVYTRVAARLAGRRYDTPVLSLPRISYSAISGIHVRCEFLPLRSVGEDPTKLIFRIEHRCSLPQDVAAAQRRKRPSGYVSTRGLRRIRSHAPCDTEGGRSAGWFTAFAGVRRLQCISTQLVCPFSSNSSDLLTSCQKSFSWSRV